jgi:hypothetical protein
MYGMFFFRRARLLAGAAVGVALLSSLVPAHGGTPPSVQIITLSNRADLISGGDALLAVDVPAGAAPSVTLDGGDVTAQFVRLSSSRWEGVVSGMPVGANVVMARLPDGTGAQLTITNHPNGGPLFAGPQMQPWKCEPGAIDAQCNKPAKYDYLYQSTNGNKAGFQPFDPAHPPSDVAVTTTDNGVTVPFVVRIETGYQDRDQYKIAVLYQPGKVWTAVRPQAQFDHKLLITHGASCDVSYEVGGAPSVTSYNPANAIGLPIPLPGAVSAALLADSAVYALGTGYAVMSTALDNTGHHCDVVDQAESLLMAKEHLIDAYGTVRYTIGTGCSGGSLAQQWIANAYPGIYQGILPTCSFPDTWSSATQVMDYHLLRTYFEHSSNQGTAWSPTQWAAVEGNLLPLDAIISDVGFFNAIVPTHSCGGISDQQRYQPQTHPTGVRCSVADMAANVFGRRQPAVWSAVEKKLGYGFVGVPVDNVGVQYGLDALRTLQITPGQFADLNARIGGLDIDINPTRARISADQPALANAYRSGMINEANNLDQTAIIDCRGPDPGAAHDSYRAFAVRDRLDRAHASHANQMIWEGPAPIIGDTKCALNSLITMDRWLAAVERDHSSRPVARKIVVDKPTGVTDQCWDGAGVHLTNDLCGAAIVPVYGTPRTVAGDARTTDANKCQMKPLNRSDYLLPFTDAQWAVMRTTFPHGVCDYSKPGVGQQPTVPWMTYQMESGQVITGGQPMPSAPRSSPLA